MRHAAIYLRISEDRSGEELAVSRQREDCRQLAAIRGWDVIAEHVDNDLSASGRKKRPGFDALLADIEAKRADVIVAWAQDRLARNARDRLRLVETCRRHSVTIALVRGSDMDATTPAGRLLIGLLGEVAQHEIDQKADRQRRQQRQAAEQGRMTGGPRPFGYLKGGMDLDPHEVPVLRQMYDRWLAGAGLGEIADYLNRNGVRTPRGLPWRISTVKVVLANPRNAGLRAMRPVVDEVTGRRDRWHAEPVAKAAWPAAVPEQTWRAAVAKLRDPTRSPLIGTTYARGPEPRHLLSKVARCGQCGQFVITGATRGVRRYTCTTKRHINRTASYVDGFVTQVLLARLSRPDAHDLLLPTPKDGPDLDVVRGQLLAARERKNSLALKVARGVLDDEQAQVAGDDLRAQIRELETTLASAGEVDIVAPLVVAEDPAEVWADYPPSTRRAVVQRLMDVTLHRGRPGRPPGGVFDTSTIEIRWRDG